MLPRDKLIVTTGISGSDKSSIAFDTIYPERQARCIEPLTVCTRQFGWLMQTPDVNSLTQART